jgi:hypothetical protein
MHKARLEKLITALEGVKPKQFDMTVYAHKCGTPACVLGHFAARKDLQKKFKFNHKGDAFSAAVLLVKGGTAVYHEDDEVLEYFGITPAQSEYLFGCEGKNEHATPAQMRRQIRKFIDNA